MIWAAGFPSISGVELLEQWWWHPLHHPGGCPAPAGSPGTGQVVPGPPPAGPRESRCRRGNRTAGYRVAPNASLAQLLLDGIAHRHHVPVVVGAAPGVAGCRTEQQPRRPKHFGGVVLHDRHLHPAVWFGGQSRPVSAALPRSGRGEPRCSCAATRCRSASRRHWASRPSSGKGGCRGFLGISGGLAAAGFCWGGSGFAEGNPGCASEAALKGRRGALVRVFQVPSAWQQPGQQTVSCPGG